MKKIAMLILFSVLYSCSNEKEEISEFLVRDISIDKTHTFTDETINLNIYADGYDEIKIISENDKIKIKKISETNFEIFSSEISSGEILVSVTSNSIPENKKQKKIDVYFTNMVLLVILL